MPNFTLYIFLYLFITNVKLTKLFNFQIINDYPNRVYFDSSSYLQKSGTTTGNNGFEVIGKSITSIYINENENKGHYIIIDTLTTKITWWDNLLIRYIGGSDIIPELDEFELEYIENYIDEPVSTSIRYVTSSSSTGKDGKSESNAWTIGEVSSKFEPGMTVYIKAGNYGNNGIVLKDGTIDEPIKLIGYKDNINDNPSLVKKLGLTFDESEMPLFEGNTGTCINVEGKDYVILKNIQIQNFGERAISVHKSSFVHIENSYIKEGKNGIWSLADWLDNVNGYNNVRIIHSYVADVTMQAILISGEFMMASHNFVCSTKDVNMDYYICFRGHPTRGYGNIIRKNYIHRFAGDSHICHGAGFKAGGNPIGAAYIQYGLIEDNEIVNCRDSVHFRHSKCMYNVARGNLIYGKDDVGGIDMAESFNMRGGHHNLIYKNIIHDVEEVIRFSNSEDTSPDGIKAGFDNVFKHNLFLNANIFVWADAGTETYNNLFFENTIVNMGSVSVISITFPTSNEFNNNIIQDCGTIDSEGSYDNNLFDNNQFGSKGTNYLRIDPYFIDSSKWDGNFRVRYNSPHMDI